VLLYICWAAVVTAFHRYQEPNLFLLRMIQVLEEWLRMRLDLLRPEVISHDIEVLKQYFKLVDDLLCHKVYLLLRFLKR